MHVSVGGAYKLDWILLSTQNVAALPITVALAIIQSSSMARWRVECQRSTRIISMIHGVSNWEERSIRSRMDRDMGMLYGVALDIITKIIGIGVIGIGDHGTTKILTDRREQRMISLQVSLVKEWSQVITLTNMYIALIYICMYEKIYLSNII